MTQIETFRFVENKIKKLEFRLRVNCYFEVYRYINMITHLNMIRYEDNCMVWLLKHEEPCMFWREPTQLGACARHACGTHCNLPSFGQSRQWYLPNYVLAHVAIYIRIKFHGCATQKRVFSWTKISAGRAFPCTFPHYLPQFTVWCHRDGEFKEYFQPEKFVSFIASPVAEKLRTYAL